MGLSIEEQREKRRKERDPKRFHSVKHLKVDPNKIKGTPKQVKEKMNRAYREVESLLGEGYYSKKKGKKKRKKNKGVKKKPKKLTKRQIKYKEYLNSEAWIQLRIDLFSYRGRVCERCTNTKNLHVHHKHYDNIFNEEPEDLEILCATCHSKEHKKKAKR